MKKLKVISLSALSFFGGMLVILGEIDDSPGLGGIGIILGLISTFFLYKNYKN
jgi:hypothetical protein